MTLSEDLKRCIRTIPDFPKKGIQFKDISTLLSNHELSNKVITEFANKLNELNVDIVIGIESRGFLFGMAMASYARLPFVPIRKHGKLPFTTISKSFDLEYGSEVIEMHVDAFEEGSRVFIHDDVLATGGTAYAAGQLVNELKGEIVGYGFLAEFTALGGRQKIAPQCNNILSLVKYE